MLTLPRLKACSAASKNEKSDLIQENWLFPPQNQQDFIENKKEAV